MNFNASYQGQVYAMNSGTLYDFRNGNLYGVSASAVMDNQAYANRIQAVLTGYYVKSNKGSIGWLTKSGKYVILDEGWQKIGTVAIAQYSQSAAQALVNKIIKNNQIIICNNLLCARYASKLTANQQAQVRALQNRLNARNSALQSGGLTANIKTSYPKGYAELAGYMDALMAGETIGMATWLIVVIACTVVAATATAAYFAYKSFAEESEKDVKYSKELTKILQSKLTEEEYQQLLQETKGIVTKARIKQAAGSYGNMLLWTAIAVGGVALYRIIKNRL